MADELHSEIGNWQLEIGNRKSAIGNRPSPPAPHRKNRRRVRRCLRREHRRDGIDPEFPIPAEALDTRLGEGVVGDDEAAGDAERDGNGETCQRSGGVQIMRGDEIADGCPEQGTR